MIGLLGKKLGMTAIFGDDGKQTAITVIQAGPCPIIQVKTKETDGYNAVQVGFDPIKMKKANSADLGHFKKSKQPPHRLLKEMTDFEGENSVGTTIDVSMFNTGDKVIVSGVSKGRGFTGVIKRYGFHMPTKTHGTHEIFRGGGSIGQASSPSRVWPGIKMPGRMGGCKVTVKNLRIVRIDKENNLIMVKGAVPGASGGYLFIKKNS